LQESIQPTPDFFNLRPKPAQQANRSRQNLPVLHWKLARAQQNYADQATDIGAHHPYRSGGLHSAISTPTVKKRSSAFVGECHSRPRDAYIHFLSVVREMPSAAAARVTLRAYF